MGKRLERWTGTFEAMKKALPKSFDGLRMVLKLAREYDKTKTIRG